MRMVRLTQDGLASFSKIHHLVCGFFRRPIKVRSVFKGNDQQVAARIRIKVENHIVEVCAVENKIVLVGVRITQRTEDAGVGFAACLLAARFIYVLVPPGSPQPIHNLSPTKAIDAIEVSYKLGGAWLPSVSLPSWLGAIAD